MSKRLEIELDELVTALSNNMKEDIKDFDDLVNLDSALERNIIIGDIVEGLGTSVDGLIRYWNRYDEKHNIPVEEREPIKLYVDSYGGSLLDAFTIIDSIKLSKTPVIGITTGAAYSGGFFIFISCDKRYAYPHASFLFHEGATANSGTSSQFENYTAFYKRQLNQLKEIVILNTNITEEEYATIRKDDVWYDVADGIEKGFIDEIVEEL